MEMRSTAHNRRLAKKRVQRLIEVLCFVSSSVLADSLVLRNPLLRQAPKRCMPGAEKSRRRDYPDDNVWFPRRTWTTLNNDFLNSTETLPRPSA
jgi:hypothetical protein